MSGFKVVIPARYASSRLPGKPLADIGGQPMVVRVVERAREAGADAVWVATDDERVATAVRAADVSVLLTAAEHPSGTDRLAELVQRLEWANDDIVVNVQGDEPLLAPALIRDVAAALEVDPAASVATAAHPIEDVETLFNPNAVKVVCDVHGRALYFSRAPIPWARDAFAGQVEPLLPEGLPVLRHIGIYAYRAGFLQRYASLEASPLEGWEALEQLRVLWHGERIAVSRVAHAPAPGVDTPADLERVRALFAAHDNQKR